MADHSQQGPFVQVSALCERVLEERTGTLSLIRVLDTWTTTAVGAEAPARMEPITLNVVYVLSLMAGAARGRHTVTLEIEKPNGITERISQLDANFASSNMGVNFLNNLNLTCEYEGIYWINTLIGTPGEDSRTLLTRTPLTVRYQRQA